MKISTIGLDLAKNWFQVHGVDAEGKVVVRRRLRRGEVLAYFQSIEPCVIGTRSANSIRAGGHLHRTEGA